MNLLDLLYIPLAIVTAPAWIGKKRGGWGSRFGNTPPLPPAKKKRILLHAVSVGEVNALRPLIPLIGPHVEVVVSTTTDTGLARATELFSAAATVVRYPLDFSWAVRRFLNAVKPDAVALVELEVWPNFIRSCKKRGIPVCIINGRLSERSSKGYHRIEGYFGRLLNDLTMVAVQDDDYAARFRALGLAPEKVVVTGSMKWDSVPVSGEAPVLAPGALELAYELGIDRTRSLIVAGSTGPGEEALLHAACPKDVQLLCAPRKPERFNEAARAMPGCARRTQRPSGSPAGKRADRFLLDTIGELRKAYTLADLVVVGRSFGDLYGSDPIEPIGLGKPTIIGPAVADFVEVVRVFEEAGGIARTNRESLPQLLRDLLTDAPKRRALVEKGRAAIRAQQGASQRHADLILRILECGGPGDRATVAGAGGCAIPENSAAAH
jgi:3-deoxy-D-manno-octulosonic-acid transferase